MNPESAGFRTQDGQSGHLLFLVFLVITMLSKPFGRSFGDVAKNSETRSRLIRVNTHIMSTFCIVYCLGN